jgi:hypothetical protein
MNFKKCLSAFAVTAALGSLTPALAGPLSAEDTTFGSFDRTSGTRSLTIGESQTVTDVDISITFAKCDDPSLGPGAPVGAPCIGSGDSFDNEVVFSLSHAGTTVNLVTENIWSGSTPGRGVVTMNFDDAGAAFPAAPTTGTFRAVGSLSAFNGLSSSGLWTLFIRDTVGADRLDYFSACVSINGDAGCGVNNVPEPGSLALVGLALAGAGMVRRRRRA